MAKKEPGKFELLRARWSERLAKSGRVFLIGLVVACGIEVLVDWNSTLFEINVLRDRMRERAFAYVEILSRAAEPALEARDGKALDAVSAGVWGDEDVALVRFCAPDGSVLFERASTDVNDAFVARRGTPIADYYAHPLARDVDGILHDPEGLRQRIAASRWRDFPQMWNDAVDKLTARFAKPKPPRAGGLVLYQDRLRTADKQRDDQLTYAVGAVKDASGKPAGAIVVAFTMDRTNAQIRTKYLKGFGMIVFFVGLILVQNVVSRRDKLRLLDLESRYGAAKEKLRAAFPADGLTTDAFRVAGAIDQAPGTVDGMAWDGVAASGAELLLVDPDGDGIDAAAVALQALRTHRALRAGGARESLLDEARAIGAAISEIPLSRPLGIALVRVSASGDVEALTSPSCGVRVVDASRARALEGAPASEVPAGIVGPLTASRGKLEAGAALVLVAGHEARGEADEVTALVRKTSALVASAAKVGRGPRAIDLDAVAEFVRRGHGERGEALESAVSDAATWARGKFPAAAGSDLAVLAIARV